MYHKLEKSHKHPGCDESEQASSIIAIVSPEQSVISQTLQVSNANLNYNFKIIYS